MAAGRRILIYSPDGYGLGHFRRCSLIADGLAAADPRNEILIVTGSPRAQSFGLSSRVDTLKLPAATKDSSGRYRSRRLSIEFSHLVRIRSAVLLSLLEQYLPDLVLVDHAPVGLAGELDPLIRRIRQLSSPPRLVLGLRDVIDSPERVDHQWHRSGAWGRLADYDEVLVYGDPRVTTTATELDLAGRLGRRPVHTGFVAAIDSPSDRETGPEPHTERPYLLVTPGGGGDGHALLRSFLAAVEAGATGDLDSLVITGPLMNGSRRTEIVDRARRLPSVHVLTFREDMRKLIRGARGVIGMGGYNTAVETMSSGVRGLLVPRERPRLEQLIRVERLSLMGWVDGCRLRSLDPDRIARFVSDLEAPKEEPATPGPALDGVANVATLLSTPLPSAPNPAATAEADRDENQMENNRV